MRSFEILGPQIYSATPSLGPSRLEDPGTVAGISIMAALKPFPV